MPRRLGEKRDVVYVGTAAIGCHASAASILLVTALTGPLSQNSFQQPPSFARPDSRGRLSPTQNKSCPANYSGNTGVFTATNSAKRLSLRRTANSSSL